MSQTGLIGAVLYARDLERLAEFYAVLTGAEKTIHDDYGVVGATPSQFVLVRIPARIAATVEIASPPEPREGTPVKLVFAVDDISRAREQAAALGGAVKPAGNEWDFEGTRVCDGHDPEGNIFQLRQSG
jgi:predicted enzyme related to lactoylglutathione lyase